MPACRSLGAGRGVFQQPFLKTWSFDDLHPNSLARRQISKDNDEGDDFPEATTYRPRFWKYGQVALEEVWRRFLNSSGVSVAAEGFLFGDLDFILVEDDHPDFDVPFVDARLVGDLSFDDQEGCIADCIFILIQISKGQSFFLGSPEFWSQSWVTFFRGFWMYGDNFPPIPILSRDKRPQTPARSEQQGEQNPGRSPVLFPRCLLGLGVSPQAVFLLSPPLSRASPLVWREVPPPTKAFLPCQAAPVVPSPNWVWTGLRFLWLRFFGSGFLSLVQSTLVGLGKGFKILNDSSFGAAGGATKKICLHREHRTLAPGQGSSIRRD